MREVTRATPEAASWDELKDELFDAEDQVEIERRAEELRAEVRAYRLAEVRKRQKTTQVELAQRMGISQSRVSDIERGRLSRSEVDTLAAYVAALGGTLKIVADFGDESLVLG
ncbi:XRE family transcriptional regulator [Yinghuangia seranimata]|uniref:XRE family transcriptional regulator n=1 Tax=Yinghuangia seranimata TaxID=408067 RepID=UPI00248C2F2F|nr:XRE family transcriptional regulator [Yinghuangia seranimata]MDI2131795.1 XRE family transcriptional regulator [Yinghuangia seranimata]